MSICWHLDAYDGLFPLIVDQVPISHIPQTWSPSWIHKRFNIAKNIQQKPMLTVQVQHDYDNWTIVIESSEAHIRANVWKIIRWICEAVSIYVIWYRLGKAVINNCRHDTTIGQVVQSNMFILAMCHSSNIIYLSSSVIEHLYNQLEKKVWWVR